MTTFNKKLINCIENDTISKEDYYKILTYLSIIKETQNKYINLEKEKLYLTNEILFIQSKDNNQIYYSTKKELNDSINRIYNIDEIELFKKLLNTKKEIYRIVQKYTNLQQSKSSIKKYLKNIQYLNNKKSKIENEIKENKESLLILKKQSHKKTNLEHYNNKLIRFQLPQIEKEILKQEFYIDIFSKNKGR